MNRGDHDSTRWDEEEGLDALLAQFDAADTALLMTYSRFMERPSDKNNEEISEARAALFDCFGHVIRSVIHGKNALSDPAQMAGTLATILQDVSKKHSELLVEYTDVIELPTEHESQEVYESLREQLQDEAEESNASLIDEALGHFRMVCDTDAEVLDVVAYKKLHSRSRQFGEQALKTAGDVAKVGGGVLLGMLVFDKIRRK